jgi:hypothetical protein
VTLQRSVVVTGGARGVGAAIARVLRDDGWSVVVLDFEGGDIQGDAGDPAIAEAAAQAATVLAPLHGWVNNAAVFADAWLHEHPDSVLETVAANIVPAIVGSAIATRHFVKTGIPGSIVNVSSHQASRPVAGALPYATAKAAIEGLTRATAVDRRTWDPGQCGGTRLDRNGAIRRIAACGAGFGASTRSHRPRPRGGHRRRASAVGCRVLRDRRGDSGRRRPFGVGTGCRGAPVRRVTGGRVDARPCVPSARS